MGQHKIPPLRTKATFHCVALLGQGFVYRVGMNLYKTFKDNNAPEDAELVVDNSYARIKKKVIAMTTYSSINGEYADILTWMERGLYIACVEADIHEDRKLGAFNIVTGQPIESLTENGD